MSPFDRLHPALQHHIVNSLGWNNLRPLQLHAIEPVLSGEDALLLAPTAGGKTEAAIFPVLSRMLSDSWPGLSVLYICPIKALLNNLEIRLRHYCGLLGRSVEVWHGDVAAGHKTRIVRETPDILLATPESLEVMLVSRRIEHSTFFANLRTVIIDEMHALAGDDRGWHLLSVLSRLQYLAGRELQRLGLSATVGNPEELLDWLAGDNRSGRQVINPSANTSASTDIQLDYVGSLSNAALVISRLHRGEKRLVFCDSRARVEQLAAELRAHEVNTFVSHSSLSIDERRRAEAAFVEASDCVIVATSTLELGIDVGDLDRVIQIDAPFTVASFLQRMGRTGRRSGSSRNCLFLATSENAFLRAAGLLHLWSRGYVEPIEPPPLPYHIFAQQIMALSLQESGIGTTQWSGWIGSVPGFTAMDTADKRQIIDYMLSKGILIDADGLLSFGLQGESQFGYRNFMQLFSVFTSPPVFTVLHGRAELGQVGEMSLRTSNGEPAVLTLAGRSWEVRHTNTSQRIAYVEPTDKRGRSRWLGSGQPSRFELRQAVADILAGGGLEDHIRLSQRAKALLAEAHEAFAWVDRESTTLVLSSDGQLRWWTFAGRLANEVLAESFKVHGLTPVVEDDAIRLGSWSTVEDARSDIHQCLQSVSVEPCGSVPQASNMKLKFRECVPDNLVDALISTRLYPTQELRDIAAKPLRVVTDRSA